MPCCITCKLPEFTCHVRLIGKPVFGGVIRQQIRIWQLFKCFLESNETKVMAGRKANVVMKPALETPWMHSGSQAHLTH